MALILSSVEINMVFTSITSIALEEREVIRWCRIGSILNKELAPSFKMQREEWFRTKDIGCHIRLSLLANSCLKEREREQFLYDIVTEDSKGLIRIILSAGNHTDIPVMLPRRGPNQIFTVPRSSSVIVYRYRRQLLSLNWA